MSGVIVVGIQWGDEGKGKIVDLLAEQVDLVVRAQGGNNAGHTVVANNQEYRLHLVPSGIISPHTRCYITGGTAIDPEILIQEIEGLERQGVVVSGRLRISSYAHIIFSYHRALDELQEKRRGAMAIGTTKQGVGPCYVDRVQRVGIRAAELIRPEILRGRLEEVIALYNREIVPPLAVEKIYETYRRCGERLKPYIGSAEVEIAAALREKKKVLFEGAHGTFLDVTFGTYPYVTASSTLAGGVCAGAGVGPSAIGKTIGIAKAYVTRVGGGPLPTALSDKERALFLSPREAREIGTTTGRERRLGWFDAPLARFGVQLNGVDQLVLTKLDVLDTLSEIRVCVDYRLRGEKLEHFPCVVQDLEQVEPIYEAMPGWQKSTKEAKRIADLPLEARRFLNRIEELCQVPLGAVSVGPGRNETLTSPEFYVA